jgi:hypothetical protein
VHFPAAPDLNGVYPVLLGVYSVLLGVYSVLLGVYSVLLFLLWFCKLSLYLDRNVILIVLSLVLFSYVYAVLWDVMCFYLWMYVCLYSLPPGISPIAVNNKYIYNIHSRNT